MIYVVLVNYKGAGDTIACLDSLGAWLKVPARVIVVDNASGDGSLELIAAWLEARAAADAGGWTPLSPGVMGRLVASPVNGGFAAGCNIGMRIALKDKACSHVWLLNNDTLLRDDALGPMVRRLEQDETIGMCGSTLVYHDAPDVVQALGGQFNILLGRGRPIGAHDVFPIVADRAEVERRMDYVVGASLLITRPCLERTGLMDERYFLYFEELDWALSAKAAGFGLGWAPDSIVFHKEGGAIGTSTRNRPSNLAIHFMRASYLRLLFRHRPYLMPLGLLRGGAAVARWLVRGDRAAARTEAVAMMAFLRHPRRSCGLAEMVR